MMCQWGDTVDLLVPIPAELSHTGKARWDVKSVDRCLAPLIKALNDRGLYTSGCCCGHSKGPGDIRFHDGQVLHLPPLDASQGGTEQ